MTNTRMARSERRDELHAGPSSNHYTKEGTKMRNRILIALVAMVAVMGFSSSVAFAQEGQDGNNLVCGGVPTKALLLKYANGGADPCGHRDIGKIWEKLGITPAVASKMHAGTVCSSEGFLSSGREHGPSEAADKAVVVEGKTDYFRPLSVWGATCYEAWVGFTEDGKKVAVLMGCGNGEGHMVKPRPKPKCVKHHKKHRKLCKKPKPRPKPTPQPVPAPATPAPAISIVNAPVFFQGQTQGQQQQQAQSVCISLGGTWNEVTQNCSITQQQAQCNENQVLIGGVCVNKTCEEMGTCKPPPPPPPPCETCECKENCKPPPPKTCAEKGLVGEYPNCHKPTCQEEGNCKPPPPPPPNFISVTTLNDVDAEGYSENFCVRAEVPGSDTGTVVMSPRYGSFGPLGGTVTVTFTGTTKKCVTYYAPTEVPPGGMDRMTVTLRDNTTGLSATPEVQEFRINEVPGNPG